MLRIKIRFVLFENDVIVERISSNLVDFTPFEVVIHARGIIEIKSVDLIKKKKKSLAGEL